MDGMKQDFLHKHFFYPSKKVRDSATSPAYPSSPGGRGGATARWSRSIRNSNAAPASPAFFQRNNTPCSLIKALWGETTGGWEAGNIYL